MKCLQEPKCDEVKQLREEVPKLKEEITNLKIRLQRSFEVVRGFGLHIDDNISPRECPFRHWVHYNVKCRGCDAWGQRDCCGCIQDYITHGFIATAIENKE